LFQGRSKIILVQKDEHFLHLPYYILSNPIKLISSKWKDRGVKNKKEVLKFLDSYKWVSFRDIVSDEKGVFSEVINKKLFLRLFGFTNKEQFKKYFKDWVSDF